MNRELIKLEINPADYKLLIVDDVISNVMLLKALLKSENYKIITANDGYEALKKVETERPDLIILDVMMPGLSGFDVSKQLQSSLEYHDIPIIFLTALNGYEDIVRGFELGGNDFVTKPFNKNELRIRIKHQISLVEAKRIITRKAEELRAIIIGRDKLYSVIAHDLRGPLGSIKMIINLILSNLDKSTIEESMFDLLKMANQTTEDVFALLDNLLKWTKSQLGKLSVVHQTSNMCDLVCDATEIFTTTAQMKEITIKFERKEVSDVIVDIDMIKTVLRNLVSNAIKFSNNGSTVTITVDEEDDGVVVNVIDTGCGITETDKFKLLDTETHFSTFGTNNEEGAGLGLLLCHDFIAKNGGRLWFESVVNEGSTFSFKVPKA